jgi:phage-related protein
MYLPFSRVRRNNLETFVSAILPITYAILSALNTVLHPIMTVVLTAIMAITNAVTTLLTKILAVIHSARRVLDCIFAPVLTGFDSLIDPQSSIGPYTWGQECPGQSHG